MSQKPLNTEDIRQKLGKEGYVLCSEYKERFTPLSIECPKGHSFEMTWDSFNRGSRCPHQCKRDKVSSKLRHPIEKVKEIVEAHGYALTTSAYLNSYTKIRIKCPRGHEHKLALSHIKKDFTCQICYWEDNGLKLEDIKSEVEQAGHTFIGMEGTSSLSLQKIRMLCSKGHESLMLYSNFQQGRRCSKCGDLSRRSNLEDISKEAEQYKYHICSTEYDNCKAKIDFICPKGHQFEMRWNDFQQGHRCPKCNVIHSLSELEIMERYSALNPIQKSRVIIKPKELDVYFPEQKVAIEYCGLYWHSDAQERIKPNYHRVKMDACNVLGIRLLTVFDDEWKEHKDICISRINTSLGIVQNKIYARKCEAKEISNIDAYEFLKRTHLQGAGKCKIAYGLFHENKLVQVMTFGSPTRAHTAKGKRVLEMKRLAGELNTIVVGGAGKLFKVGLKYAQNENYEIIKSYCDLRWGTGNLYAKLGFIKTHETKYTPHYTNGTKRFRNQQLAQNKSKTGKTESEVVLQKKLWKIYDCGHQTWIFNVI